MIVRIIEILSVFIVATISRLGYAGIVLLMAIESACIPLPSEIIMPFAGYLVYRGELSLVGVAVAGATGCVVGSLVAYAVGARGGRPAIERWGRWVLLSPRELALADRWFARWGRQTVFWARLLPVVRTFIALPAGIAKMDLWPFVWLTFAGSLPWGWALAYAGRRLAENWAHVGEGVPGGDVAGAAAGGRPQPPPPPGAGWGGGRRRGGCPRRSPTTSSTSFQRSAPSASASTITRPAPPSVRSTAACPIRIAPRRRTCCSRAPACCIPSRRSPTTRPRASSRTAAPRRSRTGTTQR